MDININQGNLGNFGIGRELEQLEQTGGAKNAAVNAERASRHSSNVTITTKQPPKLPDAEPSVGEIPESTFDRDDDLGNLVNSAFSLSPPAMPNFD